MRAARLKALFASAGWKVFEAKYGSRLEAAMSEPGGDALRRRIDDMSNEEYQALIRLRDGAELRRRLADVPDATEAQAILLAVAGIADEDLPRVVSQSGGHDLPRLLEVLAEADAVADAPVVVFAYTIKGFGLPLAGDPLNHSMLLTQTQMDELRAHLGVPGGRCLGRVPARFAGGPVVRGTGRGVLRAADGDRAAASGLGHSGEPRRHPPGDDLDPGGAGPRAGAAGGGAGGRGAGRDPLARRRDLDPPGGLDQQGRRLRAGGVGATTRRAAQRMLRWLPGPEGRHIELGISEMNLFMALGQFGLSYELTGQHLIPIGTVYDPFVCRGLDALIYGLYGGAKMIFAGTPAGVSLSARRAALTRARSRPRSASSCRGSISTSRPSPARSSGRCWKRCASAATASTASRPTSAFRPNRSTRS